jgi:phospholipid/cholesterol/gamma-HCH transport system ATP-binding protein
LDEALIREIVMLKLAMVELAPRHARLMPAELSGGMVKRVALARALALEPELLLLDEPTAGLDPDRSESFVRLIRTLHAELGLTVVLVTHDLDTLAALASRVAVLAEQRILAHGSPAEIMQIDHPFIRNFFCSARARRALRCDDGPA